MPSNLYRPAHIKLRIYDDQEELWQKVRRGEEPLRATPTGYRDGTEAEFVLDTTSPPEGGLEPR